MILRSETVNVSVCELMRGDRALYPQRHDMEICSGGSAQADVDMFGVSFPQSPNQRSRNPRN